MRTTTNRQQRRRHLQWPGNRKAQTHFGLPNRERETDDALRERLIAAGKIQPKKQEQK